MYLYLLCIIFVFNYLKPYVICFVIFASFRAGLELIYFLVPLGSPIFRVKGAWFNCHCSLKSFNRKNKHNIIFSNVLPLNTSFFSTDDLFWLQACLLIEYVHAAQSFLFPTSFVTWFHRVNSGRSFSLIASLKRKLSNIFVYCYEILCSNNEPCTRYNSPRHRYIIYFMRRLSLVFSIIYQLYLKICY